MKCEKLICLLSTHASRWTIFVRLALAGVFIPEGIQKLIYPEILGTGRFIKMGIPFPEFTGPFVGWVEIICGTLLLLGLFTRFAAVPLIVTMLVAITATKIPVWMGHDWVVTENITFYVRELKRYGFWSFMHETRLDWSMLMGACYLLAVGGGAWSLDKRLTQESPASR
ncbi:MAG: DoxX family protein [Alphaproteobacteria bacterium]|nr:DoxX family protein [Alphaproteobacteria bacterium]